jgi:hypothetical protein
MINVYEKLMRMINLLNEFYKEEILINNELNLVF